MSKQHWHKCVKCKNEIAVGCGCGYPKVNTEICFSCAESQPARKSAEGATIPRSAVYPIQPAKHNQTKRRIEAARAERLIDVEAQTGFQGMKEHVHKPANPNTLQTVCIDCQQEIQPDDKGSSDTWILIQPAKLENFIMLPGKEIKVNTVDEMCLILCLLMFLDQHWQPGTPTMKAEIYETLNTLKRYNIDVQETWLYRKRNKLVKDWHQG